MVGEVIVVVGVMVGVMVGEVADSAGIYRTIREGCPFFCGSGILFRGFASWVSFWESQANRCPQYHCGKGVGKGIMGIPGQKGGMNPRCPFVEHFVSVIAGIPKCLKPPISPEMSAPAPIQPRTAPTPNPAANGTRPIPRTQRPALLHLAHGTLHPGPRLAISVLPSPQMIHQKYPRT